MDESSANWDQAVRDEMVAILPRLRRFALGLTGRHDQADDLVQATCERAIRNMDRWLPGSRLDSWMFRMMQNLYRNQLRDGSNRVRLLDGWGAGLPTSVDGAATAADAAELGKVRQAILHLSEEHRTVLMMICVEGLSYREAADLLDVPTSTVTSRLCRARIELRELLARPLPQDKVLPPADRIRRLRPC